MQEGSTRIRKTAPFKQFQQKAPPKEPWSSNFCRKSFASSSAAVSASASPIPSHVGSKGRTLIRRRYRRATDETQMDLWWLNSYIIYIYISFFCPHPPPAPPQNGGSFKNEATYAINGRLLGATCQWKTFDCCGVWHDHLALVEGGSEPEMIETDARKENLCGSELIFGARWPNMPG